MVIVDSNVLLYAIDDTSAHHERSITWLHEALEGKEGVGLAWSALVAFIRISTNPALYARPLTVDEATKQVEDWLESTAAIVVEPTARHLPVLRGLLMEVGTAGNLTGDADLAALAIEHGADIVSYDRDFARFPGVRHRLPG